MTLTVADPLPAFIVGQSADLLVTITGGSPVHSVVIDLLADGQPAWYFVPFDGRVPQRYHIGPFKRKGRTELVVTASDEMGCSIANGLRLFLTVQ